MTACTYRDCRTPATRRLEPSTGGRPWHACPEHLPTMLAALYVGLSGNGKVADTPLEERP